MTPARRTADGDRFSHQTVVVLEAFATSVLGLHRAIEMALKQKDTLPGHWDKAAARWARDAVRCARLLAVREDYR